jgi:hypothetical protein
VVTIRPRLIHKTPMPSGSLRRPELCVRLLADTVYRAKVRTAAASDVQQDGRRGEPHGPPDNTRGHRHLPQCFKRAAVCCKRLQENRPCMLLTEGLWHP